MVLSPYIISYIPFTVIYKTSIFNIALLIVISGRGGGEEVDI